MQEEDSAPFPDLPRAMFFKKRKPTAAESAENRRAHYRQRVTGPVRLEARLHVKGWDPVTVELLDLSAGGAGIRMNLAQDRGVQVGDTIELSIGAMMRDEVKTRVRIATIKPDGANHVRYGLELVNPREVLELDGLYTRFFNRRRHVRVRPPLSERNPVMLLLSADQIQTHLHDVSQSGMSVDMGREAAPQLAKGEQLDISFQPPKSGHAVQLRATVRHSTVVNDQVRVGFEFDVNATSATALDAVRAYVASRETELEKWNKSSS